MKYLSLVLVSERRGGVHNRFMMLEFRFRHSEDNKKY